MSKLVKTAVIMVGVGIALFFLGNMFGGRGIVMNDKFRIRSVDDLEYYEYENRDLEAFTSVNINVSNMPVTFCPSDDGKYGVETAYRASDKDHMIVEVKDGTLTIRRKSEVYLFSFDFSFFGGNNTEKEYVTVYLPKQEYEAIDVSASNGPVTLKSLDVEVKTLILDTSNAPVIVSDMQADTFSAGSSNGMISLSGVRSESVRVKTSNAVVTVEDSIVAALTVKTNNGQVTLTDVECGDGEGDISVSTSNAAIFVDCPQWKEADFRIDADTSNADVYINDRSQKDDKYTTKKGDNTLRLKTSNGKIEMNFAPD